MKYIPYAAIAAVIIVVAVALAGGCRKSKPAAPPQQYEVSAASNFLVRPVEEISVLADIHLPDSFAPVRATVVVKPGVWIVPEGILTAAGDNWAICRIDSGEAVKK